MFRRKLCFNILITILCKPIKLLLILFLTEDTVSKVTFHTGKGPSLFHNDWAFVSAAIVVNCSHEPLLIYCSCFNPLRLISSVTMITQVILAHLYSRNIWR